MTLALTFLLGVVMGSVVALWYAACVKEDDE